MELKVWKGYYNDPIEIPVRICYVYFHKILKKPEIFESSKILRKQHLGDSNGFCFFRLVYLKKTSHFSLQKNAISKRNFPDFKILEKTYPEIYHTMLITFLPRRCRGSVGASWASLSSRITNLFVSTINLSNLESRIFLKYSEWL